MSAEDLRDGETILYDEVGRAYVERTVRRMVCRCAQCEDKCTRFGDFELCRTCFETHRYWGMGARRKFGRRTS